MLLTKLVRRLRTAEDGSALAGVLGVMAVGLLLSSLIITSVVGGLTFTSAQRASVSSQAASDSGIAVAQAGLENGTCEAKGGIYSSVAGEKPAYRAEVQREVTPGNWAPGCPYASDTSLKVVSRGAAERAGIPGNPSGDTTFVEAVFTMPPKDTSVAGSGPAVYAYSSSGFGGGGVLVSVDGSSPSVLVKSGNVTCSGGSNGGADWVVENGNLTLSGSCKLEGNVWASGNVTVDGGTEIGKNLVAKNITASSKIGGSIWATDDITLGYSIAVGGDATATNINFNGGTVKGAAWARNKATLTGWTSSAGSLRAKTVTGTSTTFAKGITVVPAGPGNGPAAPAKPVVAKWVNFEYALTDWIGFTQKVMPAGTCSYASINAQLIALGTSAGIIDARKCTNGVDIAGADVFTLKNDLVIIANKINLGGGGGFKSSGGDRRLWLIEPDTIVETPTAPSCAPGQSFAITGGWLMDPSNISTMIYTPCRVNIGSSTNFYGQIFAGEASIDGGARVGYVPVGLPNVDLNTGDPFEGDDGKLDLTLKSIRNVSNGG